MPVRWRSQPFRGTSREPRIALGVALNRTPPGRASIADLAAALNVLTAVSGEQDDASPLDIVEAHRRRIKAVAVVEDCGGPLIISAGNDGALRSWRLDGTPGPLQVPDEHGGSILACLPQPAAARSLPVCAAGEARREPGDTLDRIQDSGELHHSDSRRVTATMVTAAAGSCTTTSRLPSDSGQLSAAVCQGDRREAVREHTPPLACNDESMSAAERVR